MSCKSKNLLYCIICNNCGEEYIGQTVTQLTARMRLHRQQINDPSIRNTPCSEHFDTCAKWEITKFFLFITLNRVNVYATCKRKLFHEAIFAKT